MIQLIIFIFLVTKSTILTNNYEGTRNQWTQRAYHLKGLNLCKVTKNDKTHYN